jgi:predicted P-loop ATPase
MTGKTEDTRDYVGEALKRAKIPDPRKQPQSRKRTKGNGADPGPPWLELCHKGKHGPLQTVENALIALANDSSLKDALRFDELARIITLEHAIPGAGHGRYPRNLSDEDRTTIQSYLQHNGLNTIARGTVDHAIEATAVRHSYHPIKTFLNTLTWDRTQRLNTWLPKTTGAQDNDYHRSIGRMFAVAMAARIFEPGCQADYMIILEGEQGELKSKMCRTLAGEWFSDNMPDISAAPKDASLHLRGKWLIEIAEMHAFNKAESTHLKQFITRTTERYRPPYGRGDVIEPRQCLFIGTTNKEVYLKDETGGRRFWPIKAGTINIDWIEANRDQLFAEAVQAYREGCQWWPSREDERKYIRPQQDARYDADAWEQAIITFLTATTLPDVTVMEVATGALGYEHGNAGPGGTPINRLSRADQNRIMTILTALGWERAPRKDIRRAWHPRYRDTHDA